MYFFIVLFFVSLLGIILMVGRKLRLLESGQVSPPTYVPFEVPRLEEMQKISGKILRSLGYFLLVEAIRMYVRLGQFLKNTYQKAKTRLAERRRGNDAAPSLNKEPNRFLKTIAQYKKKISKIKDEIKEEESL